MSNQPRSIAAMLSSSAGPAAETSDDSMPETPRVYGSQFICAKTLGFVLTFLAREKGQIKDSDFFDFIVRVLEHRAVIDLVRASCPLEALDERIRERLETGRAVPQDLLIAVWNEPRTHASCKRALLTALDKERNRLNKFASLDQNQDIVRGRFAEIVSLFALSECEADLLLLAYVRHAGIWNWAGAADSRRSGRVVRIEMMCRALDVPLAVVGKLLWKSARLRTLGCLDGDLDFNAELEPFLVGLTDEPLASKYFARQTEPALPWEMHGRLAAEHGEFLKSLISRRDPAHGINILLYGAPGTGKTSFAASLAARLGLDLYRIRVPEESDADIEDNSSRFAAVRICDSQVNRDRSMILIDEADDMLAVRGGVIRMLLGGGKTAGVGKETLNTILDQLKTPCIWITNTSPEALDLSSRRRFDYSICFKPLSHQQRCQVWKNLAGRYDLQTVLDDSTIDQLARRFGVSAGGVDLALRNYARLCGDGSTPIRAATEILERLLIPHCELLGISADNAAAMGVGDYSLAGLNVRNQVQPQRVLEAMRQFRLRQEPHWLADRKPNLNAPRMTLLLSGPPGTGKTEFVKFLGHELDCSVRTCMAGDLLNKYVGGTEENIREAFRAAEADQAILFIDEADGMLRSRRLAERSWEVTQVNELLHAMETFNGVLVCATNSIEMLDPATIRRFTFKLEFDYLDAAGKLIFYEKMFSGFCKTPLDDNGRRCLEAIANLAPGDFHTVRQAMYYLGSAGGGQGVTHKELLAALEQESRAKWQGRNGNFGFGQG